MRLLRRRPVRDPDRLQAEIDELIEAPAARDDPQRAGRLLALRHLCGIELLEAAGDSAQYAVPDGEPPRSELPWVPAAQLSAGLLRGGILRDGFVLVRGLLDRDLATALAEQIERAYTARERREAGQPAEPGHYEEFVADPRFPPEETREWVKLGGGLLAADSPLASLALTRALRDAGVPALASAYLGEPALVSTQKTTLRKTAPAVMRNAWHQDGKFMGAVRSLNLWLALSDCGERAPGIDLVPRRLEHFVTTATEGALLDYTISDAVARAAAGDAGVVRPVFEPGDALLFDEWCLHSTATDPAMPDHRYAVENWFFGASGFPSQYAPLSA